MIGGVETRPLGGTVFTGQVSTRRLGPLIAFALETGPHRVEWNPRTRDRSSESFLRVRFQRTGSSTVQVDDGNVYTHPGEWSVVDGSRDHAIVNEVDASTISLQIPRSQLSDREFDVARRMRGPFATAGGISHLLYHCLRLAIEDLDDARDSTDQELGQSMLDMFRIMLNDYDQARTRPTMRDTAGSRIRAFIRRNLADPDLSVEMIASAMKCSRRYVHKVFEGGETVSQYIWTQRLEGCRLRLSDAECRPGTLTELAFEFGFRSSAHFSRAFRAKHGVTPSQFRAEALRVATTKQ
jgi:AraC-like DNA-binding protein